LGADFGADSSGHRNLWRRNQVMRSTSYGVDRPLILCTVLLAAAGIAALYSAGLTDVPSPAAGMWHRQLMWVGIGTAAALLVFRISPRLLEWATPTVYLVAMLLLVFTLIEGTGAGTAAGSKSWITIAGARIGQPAELAKLATIMMLARHLAGKR